MNSKLTPQKFSFYKLIPILLLLLGLISFFYFRLEKYLSFETLQNQRNILHSWTTQHSIISPIIYMIIYIIAVAISIPGAIFLTLIGGFLFGIIPGIVYALISATIGSAILFLAARNAFNVFFALKAKPWLKKMEIGFQQNALQYLLFLRLVPLFPFWLVNIVPALMNVRLRTFLIATFIGIIPGTAVYVSVGNGLDAIFKSGQTPNLAIIFKPTILLPLIGLAILSLIPLFCKNWKGHHETNTKH